jgi:phospholipid/cholesterol/gamma-HCH transport system ATP-binding protein
MVKFKNFKKSFYDKVIHKDINFKINSGECIGLLGGSGAGKSVILRSIIGLEKPDSGEIWIEDEEISQYTEEQLIEIRKKVAYVFQNGALFDSMSVYENMAYPLRAHTSLTEKEVKLKIHDLLEYLGMHNTEHLLPNELSGGMQKRIGLARSIILEPSVILYDEPTAGLDPFNTKKIQEIILKLKKKNVTSIFVTHDIPSALAVCNRFLFVQNGVIAKQATLEEIINETADPLILKFLRGDNFYES